MTRELGAKQPLWQICQISKTIVRVSFNLWQGIKPFEKGWEKRPKLFLYIPKISFICEVNPSGPICNSQSIMLMALDEVRRELCRGFHQNIFRPQLIFVFRAASESISKSLVSISSN